MRPEDQVKDQPIQPIVAGREVVRTEDKAMIILSYFGLLALIPLLTVKDSEFVRWHAKNGLVLGLGGGLAIAVLSILIGWIPLIGGLLVMGAWLALIALHILCIVKGLEGVRYRVPVVSDLAEKL